MYIIFPSLSAGNFLHGILSHKYSFSIKTKLDNWHTLLSFYSLYDSTIPIPTKIDSQPSTPAKHAFSQAISASPGVTTPCTIAYARGTEGGGGNNSGTCVRNSSRNVVGRPVSHTNVSVHASDNERTTERRQGQGASGRKEGRVAQKSNTVSL